MNARRATLNVVIALIALNLLLSFGNAWPTLWPLPLPRLSLDLAAIALVLSVLSLRGPVRAAGVRWASIVVVIGIVLHYINVTVPAILGRKLDLYWDGQHAWNVVRMGAESPSAMKLVAVAVTVVLALALLYALIRRCLLVLAEGLQHRRLRTGVLAISLTTLGLWGLAPPLQGSFAPSVVSLVADQASMLQRALFSTDDELQLGTSPRFDSNLAALQGADVVIVFAEAYGAVTLDQPEFAAALGQSRHHLEAAIAASGRRAVSARLTSPTFGGGSWLAHAELLSGLDMHDPNHYRLLLKTQRPGLVSHFSENGYRTIGWMPGIQHPWPEGRFYGFDRIGDADGIGYRGPPFGYWRIPDQAAMALLQDQELGTARGDDPRPRLAVFPTLSTHAPFRPLAPYLTDWSALLGSHVYADPDAITARNAAVSWDEPIPAYLAALRYQFDWLSGWLREQAPPKAVVIVIGDHQPIGTVSGPGADWVVPVHVITSNEIVLKRLAARGFQAGLLPDKPALGPMRALTPMLVETFAIE